MTIDAIEKILNGIPQEDLDKAQEKLNQLCKEHKLKPIKLNHGKDKWRELCYRMIGLPHTESENGRPKERSYDESWSIGNHIKCLTEFPEFNDKGKEIGKPIPTKEAIARVNKSVESQKYDNKPAKNAARGIFYNEFPDLEIKRKKEQQDDESDVGADYPPEYYNNFYKNNPPKNKKVT